MPTTSSTTTPLTLTELATAFNAHCGALGKPIRCACCSGVDLQFNRLAVLPDMAVDATPTEECTPVALILCRECYHLMPFAWLPILDSVVKDTSASQLTGLLTTLSRIVAAAKNAVKRT